MPSPPDLPVVAVIGVGSPFAADSLGWLAIDELRRSLPADGFPVALRFEQLDRPGPSLLSAMRNVDLAVVVDAVDTPMPGVLKVTLDELLQRDGLTSSHGFGVAETLALGRALHDLPANLWLYGVPMGSVGEAWKGALAHRLAGDLVDWLKQVNQ